MAARSFLGAGDIYINRMVDGIPQGMVGPFKANKLSITPKVDKKQSTSKGRYDYGQVLETVNIAQPTEFSLELKEVTGDVLVMAFLGTSAAFTQAGGTATALTITATARDVWLDLGKKNLGTTFTLTNSAASTTYVEGTDYVLNRPLGWIKILSTGAIAAAASLKWTNTYKAATGSKISGSTRTEVRAYVVFDGINQADGTQCTVDIWEAVLSADSEFDFLADEFGTVALTGQLKTPTNKTEPYTVLVQDPVV